MAIRGVGGLCSLALGMTLLFAASAHANQTPGATYTGTFYGSNSGAGFDNPIAGTMEFDVSADGTQVTRFVVTNVAGKNPVSSGNCEMSAASPAPVAIVGESETSSFPSFESPGFDFGNHPGFEFEGNFTIPNEAIGLIRILETDENNSPTCATGFQQIGRIWYEAKTGGGCEGSEDYTTAAAKVAKYKTALSKVKKKLAVATTEFEDATAKRDRAKKKLDQVKTKRERAKAESALEKAAAALLDAKHTLNKLKRKKTKLQQQLKTSKVALAQVCEIQY